MNRKEEMKKEEIMGEASGSRTGVTLDLLVRHRPLFVDLFGIHNIVPFILKVVLPHSISRPILLLFLVFSAMTAVVRGGVAQDNKS